MNGKRDALYTVTFGLCLVLIMATVLFVLVGFNPKDESYNILPWIYSGLSLVGAVACGFISARLARKPTSAKEQSQHIDTQ